MGENKNIEHRVNLGSFPAMGLTLCNDCRSQISDRVLSCPFCGGPVKNHTEVRKEPSALEKKIDTRVVTELTSKKLKKRILISALLFWIGIIGTMVLPHIVEADKLPPVFLATAIVLMIFTGMIMWIVTKIKIWWHHK